MAGTFKKGKTRTFVDTSKNIWCPYCDWRVSDSMASRRRLGVHVANYHYDEIAYPVGVEPDNLEKESENYDATSDTIFST